MKSGYISVLSGLLSLAFLPNASGFESDEHKLLGDTAIKVMANRYGCYQDNSANKAICEILTRIDGSKNTVPSYGDIVACVDYFLTPEKLMSDYEESDKHLIEQWPAKPCNGSQKNLMQASHANHTHFQKELLVSLNTYHFMATSMAKNKNNIAGALFTNAIADHYLQDFFAPGHITVRRSKITDLFANALHDGTNEQGATFHPGTGKVFDRLKEIIAEIYALKSMGADADSNSVSICQFLLGSARTKVKACNLPEPDFPVNGVMLKGDHLLNRDNGYQQRMLMLAANALSLEDVLKAGQEEQIRNSFVDYEFKFKINSSLTIFDKDYRIPDINAELPFGYYALGINPRTGNTDDKYLPWARDYVWAASIAEEQFSSGAGVARTAATLEVVPFGVVGDGFFANYGVAFGMYHYGGSADVEGNGGSIRLGFIIPETESTLSFGVRRVQHHGTTMNEWGNGWNVRFDQGYSSFFSLFISAGRDFSAETGSKLAFGNYLSAGILLAAPTGRIKRCLFERCM